MGSGLGALGTAVALDGFLIFTDKEPCVLRLAGRTKALNGGRGDLVAYDFAQPSPFRSCFDLLLAADVLFLDRLAVPLFTAFEQLQPAVGILGHELRRAVYKGPDGQPCLEAEDSALEAFRKCAADVTVKETQEALEIEPE